MTRLFANFLLIVAISSITDQASATKFLNYKDPREIDTVYNDDVFISGARRIKFDSKVNGDLFSISYEMVQTDTITGNFMAVASSMQNLGPVLGSYRAVAWELSCISDVGRNVLFLAHDVNIGPESHIGRDADIAASEVVFQGNIKGNLNITGKNAMISGNVDGDLNFRGDSLAINPNTTIAGDINYHSPIRAVVAPGSMIKGKINWEKAEIKKEKDQGGPWILSTWIISIRGYFILSSLISGLVIAATFIKFPTWFMLVSLWLILMVSGNLLILFSKSRAAYTEKTLEARMFPSMGLGFIFFFLTPILSLILLFSVLAAALAPVVIMLFGVAVFAGGIYTSLFVGRRICSIFSPASNNTPGYLCYTIGMTPLLFLSFVPVAGYILLLVVLMTGLGGLLQTFRKPRGGSVEDEKSA